MASFLCTNFTGASISYSKDINYIPLGLTLRDSSLHNHLFKGSNTNMSYSELPGVHHSVHELGDSIHFLTIIILTKDSKDMKTYFEK